MAKCKICKNNFERFRPLQQVCSSGCALLYSRLQKQKLNAKKSKEQTKKLKESIMTRTEYLKLLQTVFNTYIRMRDKNLPCISCGTAKHDIQYHAGHYRSVGAAPELRFNELNVHKQCATCNNHLSGNLIEYRRGLIKRIGIEQVELLESDHEPLKLSIDQIKELIKEYKLKIKHT